MNKRYDFWAGVNHSVIKGLVQMLLFYLKIFSVLKIQLSLLCSAG